MIAPDQCPKLARGVRLQEDRVRGGFNLLAPEHVLRVNGSSAAILKLCDGATSLNEIVDELAAAFDADRVRIDADVTAILADLMARRMVEP